MEWHSSYRRSHVGWALMIVFLMQAGCSRMVQNGLTELVSEPNLPSLTHRSPTLDLDRIKVDPLLFEQAEQVAIASNPTPVRTEIEIRNSTATFLAAEPNHELKAFRTDGASAILQPLPVDSLNGDSFGAISDIVEVQLQEEEILGTVGKASGADIDDYSFRPTTSLQEINDFQPNLEAGEPSIVAITASSTRPDPLSTTRLESFVSNQMTGMVPPFANHPSLETGEPNAMVDPDHVSTECEIDTHQASDDGGWNDAESQVGVCVVDRQTESIAMPELETPSLDWTVQLDKTIEVFQQAIEQIGQNAASHQPPIESLERGLQVLNSIKASLSDGSMNFGSNWQLSTYWEHQLEALDYLLPAPRDESEFPMLATQALQQLVFATDELRRTLPLKLTSAELCSKVFGYGQFEGYGPEPMSAGQIVLVYCELENFIPQHEPVDGAPAFVTRIRSGFEITDSSGQVVQKTEFPVVTDTARKVRRDFFMHLPIQFGDLPDGDYQLQVQVTDVGSGKTASLQSPLPFSMQTKPRS